MNKIIFFLAFILLSFQQLYAENRIKYTINDSWQFIKNNEITDANEFISHIENAEIVNIPHTWNDKDVIDEEEGYYRGAGWYTKDIRIPSSYCNKQLFLFFEGAATKTDVYINRQLACEHVGSFTRFVVPVSKYINFDKNNEFSTFEVLVKADNSYNNDWPVLSADFTFFGGIYRDINLIATQKIHFNLEDYASNGVFITTPKVSAETANVSLKVRIKNEEISIKKVKLITRIFSHQNVLVQEKTKQIKLEAGITNEFEFAMDPLSNPQLWSPDTPNLYRVVCEIVDIKTNQRIDKVVNPLGLRWFSFDIEKGFFLNGKHLKLIGTNRHQDFDRLGNAIPDHIHIEDIIRMKTMGSNFLRISHYPQDPAILEMCDRLGIITSVETPIIDFVTETDAFVSNCLSAQKEMIRQNFNHPSLIIWAYMNEVLLRPPYTKNTERYKKYTDFVVELAQKIEDLTRAEDPYRYTMIPNHGGMERYKEAGLTEVPMIVGWNIYDGWYGRGYENLQPKLESFHAGVQKPMIITEYGAGVDPRLHTLTPTRFDFTQEYAVMYHNHYLKYFQSTPFIAGANVWNYADFNSEARVDAVQSTNNKGLVSIDRKPKDVFYFYQATLLKEPFIAIGTKTWGQRSYIEDTVGSGISTMPVQVFTNQDVIELYLNGKSLGLKKMDSVITVFQVPFINGINKLRAVIPSGKYCEDLSEIRINVLPLELNNFPVGGIAVNTGDQRFFYDNVIDKAWMFDKEFSEGSWGHIGGKPYVRPEKNVQQPYGAKQTIKGTFNDPIYQTQLIGINQYRFDAPAGVYEVTLHFAELEGKSVKHLPYDLADENQNIKQTTNRTFSVLINQQKILDKIDLLDQHGEYTAIKIKSEVSIEDNEPIIIDFEKIVGEPVLNAIEIHKRL